MDECCIAWLEDHSYQFPRRSGERAILPITISSTSGYFSSRLPDSYLKPYLVVCPSEG